MFIEILFKMLLFKGGVLIYAEHCIYIYTYTYIYIHTHTHTHSALQKYWNSKGKIALLAVESRDLEI